MARQHSNTVTLDEQRLEMTYEEIPAWAGDETRAEWVDGEAILVEMPSTIHQAIILFLATLMSQYARILDLGRVLIAPYEMRLAPVRSARQPNIIFVGREHVERITEDRLVGPADLAVEVISPDSLTRDNRDKLIEYQQAGVPEYWIVGPRERRCSVTPYILTDRGVYREIMPDERGRLQSIVLPGFWLDPSWLWQEPLPDLLTMLARIAPTALRKALAVTVPTEEDEPPGV